MVPILKSFVLLGVGVTDFDLEGIGWGILNQACTKPITTSLASLFGTGLSEKL